MLMCKNWSPGSTFHHVVFGPVLGVPVRLSGSVQVLEDVDVWCKVDHVLFTAAIRHLDQRVQATDGRAEDVAYITMETRQIRRSENQTEDKKQGKALPSLQFVFTAHVS